MNIEVVVLYQIVNMKLRSVLAAVLVGAAFTQVATATNAATLINENFGSNNPDRFNVSTGNIAPAFTVTAGNVDLIGNGGTFDLYPGNGNYIDLNGNTTGEISSTSSFNFSGTDTTVLSFDYGSNGTGTSADIFLGATRLLSVLGNASPTLTHINFSIVGPVSGNLIFSSTNAGPGGIVLDNVVLNSTPATGSTPVPEPSEIVGTLIGGITILRMGYKAAARKKLVINQ